MPDVSEGSVVDGRYEVLRRLGTGGMADVWLAEDTHLQRQVALKVRVLGQPDVGHPTGADPAQHPVTTVDDAPLVHISHNRLLVCSRHSPFRIDSATSRKIGAATSLPNWVVHSTEAAIAI